MKSYKLLGLIWILLLSTSVFSQSFKVDTLDQYIKNLMTELEVPGMAVAVVKDGEIAYQKVFGVKTKGQDDFVDENTLFGIGSITKSITALSLGILVDEGKIEWDDKVKDYLPYFELYDPYVTNSFTIRDLLTHRSGLRPVSGGLLWYGSDLDREQVVRKMKCLKPVEEFRRKPAYQNLTYVAGGEIVEVVAGKSWDDFIRTRIFEPLGMNNTKSLFRDIVGTSNIATPHTKDPEYNVIPIQHRNHDNIGPAGAVYSTAKDMAQYIKLVLNKGIFEGDTIVNPEVMSEILKPQTLFPIFEKPIHNDFSSYGFGWWITPKNGGKVVEHSGGVDGMVANLEMVLDDNFGIIALSNAEEMAAVALSLNMVGNVLGQEAVYKEYEETRIADRKARKTKAKENEKKLRASRVKGTDGLSSQKLVGTFHDQMYGNILVRESDSGKLELAFSHTPTFTGQLSHWNYNTYRIDWYDPMVPNGFVTFVQNSRGEVKEIQFDQPNMLDVDFSELGVVKKVRKEYTHN